MAVGIVVVSHSAPLAEAVAELARAVSTAEVRLALAAGVDDPHHPLGTDASRVLAAIESVDGEDGVLVLMDMGSAVLSAELACDLLPEATRARVLLCEAPLVEGLIAAAVQAAAGMDLERVAAEARNGLAAKIAQLGPVVSDPPLQADLQPGLAQSADDPAATLRLVIANPHGLHARPAARIVATLAPLDVTVTIRDLTTDGAPVPADSLNSLITLGVREGHEIEVRAGGPDAPHALALLRALAAEHFGDAGADDRAAALAPVVALPAGGAGLPTATGTVPGVIQGLGAAPGLAVGEVALLPGATDAGKARGLGRRRVRGHEAADGDLVGERAGLQRALDRVAAGLTATRRSVAARGGEDAAVIIDAHLLLLSDPALLDPVLAAIATGALAADAWEGSVDAVVASYQGLDDPYLAGRAADVASIGDEVAAELNPKPAVEPAGTAEGATAEPAGVLVGADLTSALAARLDPTRVDAVVTAAGTPTSHAAILARALGIPAVVGAGQAVLDLVVGTTVIVDGDRGCVLAEPAPDVLAETNLRIAASRRSHEAATTAAQAPAVTQDGIGIQVLANVGLPRDAVRAHDEGADGIGLLRSELLFLDRAVPPAEAEQVAVYEAVCAAMDGKPVVLRTLDIGGDKPVPYVDVPAEANPFLGDRGIRLTLARPALLTAQLRAALRVAVDRPLRLLLPMVSRVSEVRAARALLDDARRALRAEGLTACDRIELGVMIEVPALALGIRHVLTEVDFVSIGTNDLTQYVMAAERGNAAVAHLADPLEPAVLRLIGEVCEAASMTGTPVAVCGGVAADPAAIAVLIGLGVTELSVPPPSVASIKERVRATDVGAAQALAREALAAVDAGAVRALLLAVPPAQDGLHAQE